ncbi:MAG: hypothetical protein ACOCWE_03990 [Bacillota bacterium]
MEDNKEKKKKLNIRDNLILKYILFFAIIAVVFAAGAVIFNYVQRTAFQPERADSEIEVAGANNSVHDNYKNQLEKIRVDSDLNLTDIQDDLSLSQGNQLFLLEERKKLLADQYYLIGERNLKNRLDAIERSQEQELEEFATRRQNEIQAQIAEKRKEINQKIADLEAGLSEEQLASLKDFRQDLLSDHRAELLNLRVKLRVLDLTPAREAEIRERLSEIEGEVASQVENIRAGFEAEVSQDIYERAIELQDEFSDYQTAQQQILDQEIEAKRNELDKKLEEDREELYTELENNYQNNLESQAEDLAWLESNFQYLSRELEEEDG